MSSDVKILLIGGTSHVGKSTIAQRLAQRLGWNCLSTDQVARHPGRPWREDGKPLPQDVIDHYSTTSTDQLVDAVVSHYQGNVGPIVTALVNSHLNNPFEPHLVFEGSAILPDLVAGFDPDRTRHVWLSATESTIKARIYNDSGGQSDPTVRELIDAFLNRTLAFNRWLQHAVQARGGVLHDATDPHIESQLAQLCAANDHLENQGGTP